jgi:hypothetical protein
MMLITSLSHTAIPRVRQPTWPNTPPWSRPGGLMDHMSRGFARGFRGLSPVGNLSRTCGARLKKINPFSLVWEPRFAALGQERRCCRTILYGLCPATFWAAFVRWANL